MKALSSESLNSIGWFGSPSWTQIGSPPPTRHRPPPLNPPPWLPTFTFIFINLLLLVPHFSCKLERENEILSGERVAQIHSTKHSNEKPWPLPFLSWALPLIVLVFQLQPQEHNLKEPQGYRHNGQFFTLNSTYCISIWCICVCMYVCVCIYIFLLRSNYLNYIEIGNKCYHHTVS